MAFQLRSKDGCVIKRNDKDIFGSDSVEIKIEQLDEKEMTFIAAASTEDEDRSKDIIHQSGWDLSNFRKNPVVPLNHNYHSLPVARSVRTWVSKTKGSKLMFKPKFDPDDDNAKATFNKYKNGFLTSFSVGFIPHEVKYRDEENWWNSGREFFKQELLEISCVTVPDNPNASVMFSFGEKENMLSCGYSEYFTKTDSGDLYYPVKDIVLYAKPEVVKLSDDVSVIKSTKLVDGDDIVEPVAYIFKSDTFDQNAVRDWLYKNHREDIEKKIYYSFNVSDDQIILDKVEEEKSVDFDKDFVEKVKLPENDDTENVDLLEKEIVTNDAQKLLKDVLGAFDDLIAKYEEQSKKILDKISELVDNKGIADDGNSDDVIEIDDSVFKTEDSIDFNKINLSELFDSDVTKETVKEKIVQQVKNRIEMMFSNYGKID